MVHGKKGGSSPEFPSCTSLEFLAHFLGHHLEMHVVSQFLVHFVHLSGRAQLAHSAFSCCGGDLVVKRNENSAPLAAETCCSSTCPM